MRLVVVMLSCLVLFPGVLPLVYGQQATAVVQKISHTAGEEGTERVEIQLNGPHPLNIFMLPGEDPRLVLDFPESSYPGKSPVAVTAGTLVRGIRVGVHGAPKPKTRVVIDLKPGSKAEWSKDFIVSQNLLVITLATEGEIAAPAPVPESAPAIVVLPAGKAKIKLQPEERTLVAEETMQEAPPPPEPTPAPEDTVVAATDEARKVSPAAQADAVPVLVEVSFDNEYTRSGEMVLLKLNDFFPPEISAQEEAPPRIFCDFARAKIGKGVQNDIHAGGKFIEKIRVRRDDDQEKVRVTLDLAAGNNYDLQQVFFKEDNLFVLIVNLLDSEKQEVE